MLHNYPERKAFSPGRQTFTAIQAKQPDSPHDGWFFGLDGVENGLYGGVGVEKQGHIPHHGGVLGRHLRAGKRDRLQGLRLHLEEHWRLWQLVLLLPLRVQLADPSRRLRSRGAGGRGGGGGGGGRGRGGGGGGGGEVLPRPPAHGRRGGRPRGG